MTHPYLLALGVGYVLDRSDFNLQDLFDEAFGRPTADQPTEEIPATEEIPPAEIPPMEIPPETEVLPPGPGEQPPPFEDPFKDPLEIPPELEGPIPEEVLKKAREKYGPSSELGPLGLPSPFEEVEEAIPGFVAPPLEVFVRTILPPVRRAPTLQALISEPSESESRTITPTISPGISAATISRTELRGQFRGPMLMGLRFS